MNLQEMKSYKQELITQGHGVYPTIVKIVDTLGEYKTLRGRNYMALEYDGITALHFVNIIRAKVGSRGSFQGWLHHDYIFVTVGNFVQFCPFRSDRVMIIYRDDETTEVNQADRDNQIFVPYHMDWYNRILTLLPKAEGILGEASHNESQAELSKLSKELFLEERK
ncbi:MAG: hypothetical protein WC333_06955 [Dehalococcoidia bacterium]|jgi:hypothetical protein